MRIEIGARKRWLVGLALLVSMVGAGVASRSKKPGSSALEDGTSASRAGTSTTAEAAARSRARPALVTIAQGTLRLEGQAVDEDDKPIGGAQITLGGARSVASELDGSFAFDDLAPGSYALIAEKGLLYGEEREAKLDAGSEPVTVKLTIGLTLVVHVVEPTGAPVEGAKVEASQRAAITGEDGTVRLRGVDLGRAHVAVSAPHHESSRDRIETGDDPAATIDHTVVLGAAAEVAGLVVDEEGKPVPYAYVELEAKGRRNEMVVSEVDGTWSIPDLGAGHYTAHASSIVHIAAPDLTLELDGTHSRLGILLHVARGGEIAGLVVDATGKPIGEASVTVGSKTETTDATGHFVSKGLVPDSYDVSANTGTLGGASQQVKLERNAHVELRLVLRASSLAGLVVDEHGKPVDDAIVSARSPDPHGFGYGRTEANGRFDLGGLPPGDYELTAERGDRKGPDAAVPLHVSTENRALRLVLPQLAAVTGRVVLDGKPVPYFGIAITEDAAPVTFERPTSIRDPEGRFASRGLTAGVRGVVIVGPGFLRKVISGVRLGAGETTDLGDIAVEHGAIVSGRVIGERGQPIAGATVRLDDGWHGRDTDRLRLLLADSYTATTDATGAYRIEGITPADEPRRIVATHPTLGSSAWRELAASETELDLVIAATGAIDGIVRGAADSSYVAVSATLVTDSGASYRADVDAEGGFHVEALPPGDYDVKLRGHRTLAPQHVTVVAGARVTAAFDIPAVPVTLTVRVAGDCDLIGLGAGGNANYLIETCTGGAATFTDISPGRYDACVGLTACTPIVVPAQPAVTIAL